MRSGWQSGVGGTLNTASVEFWFEFGSTYSYLSSARIEDTPAAAGVPVLWEPFLLGPIFGEQQAPENKRRLGEQTRRAKELGIFGGPSFVVGAELFWGNDRLEDALAWAGSRTGKARR